ncbi:MAG: hypothetical protein AAGA70_12850 [Pseudomonadota bacterium]
MKAIGVRARAVLAALAVALPLAVEAQVALGDFYQFQTRFGEVQIVGGEVDQYVSFAGTMRDDLYAPSQSILGGFAIASSAEDWVLLRQNNNGNGCFGVHVLLRVDASGLTASPPFGHCEATVRDVRVYPGRIELELSSPGQTGAEAFSFDGREVRSASGTLRSDPVPAGAGPDVLRWLGLHPFAPFDMMAERARFAQIMPENRIWGLANHVAHGSQTRQEGDWVIGSGCLFSDCAYNARGFWALRISDGAAGAAILGGSTTLYGAAESDPILRRAISELGR